MLYHNRADRDKKFDYNDTYSENSYDLNGYDDTVRAAVKTLRKRKDEFDVIAVRGMSGVIVGAPVSLILKKELVVSRKDAESSHQSYGNVINARVLPGARCVFLDDLRATGNTYRAVCDDVSKRGGKIVAEYLYEADIYTEV